MDEYVLNYEGPDINTAIGNALAAPTTYVKTDDLAQTTGSDTGKVMSQKAVTDAIADFITASVSNLANYYLKSETYTRTEINSLIAALKQFSYEVVAELPAASAATMHKIYLVPSANAETQNVKDEYITIQSDGGYAWELIGSTNVDLSGYYNKTEVDTIAAAKVDKVTGKGLSTNDFTDTYKDQLDSLSERINEDGVFIMVNRKSDNYPIMYKPSQWPAQQAAGEVATGVVLVEGGRLLVIAPTEAAGILLWGSANVGGGGFTTQDQETACGDWAGEANTAAQITHAELSGAAYAPGFCAQYSRVNANGYGIAAGGWWLPSLGQMTAINANLTKINYALSLIDGATQIQETTYWTSTEFSNQYAWYLSLDSGRMYVNPKGSDKYRVRPVSAFVGNAPDAGMDCNQMRVISEALVQMAARLDALEAQRGRFGNATAGTLDALEYKKYLYPIVVMAHGVPSASVRPVNVDDGLPWDGIPAFAGQFYINLDAESGGLYHANGTTAVSDWKQ